MVIKKQLPLYLVFGIPLALLLTVLFLTTRIPFVSQSFLFSNAIVVDLLLTIPIIYFLLIKKTSIPKITVIPVFVLGTLLSSLFIPKEDQVLLQLVITYILPIVELGVFLFVSVTVFKLIKEFRRNRFIYPDFYENLKISASKLLPNKVSGLLATEISVLYYGFIYWRNRKIGVNEFTYHKNSGTIGLFIGFILIIAVEMSVVHILLAKWNDTIAWVLTALSIYSVVQMFGFLKTVIKRPILIANNMLKLRYGILSEVEFSLDIIDTVELSTKELEEDSTIEYLSPLKKLESHNIIIHLKEACVIKGLYGMQKTTNKIALFVDKPSGLVEYINKKEKPSLT